mmetsp:Transcript_1892/g.3934  ORF Transcript_1892/g.3934 Transcript_1892/m.3934 type:complete len:204 (+) Transcript_1892:628-1239(+)
MTVRNHINDNTCTIPATAPGMPPPTARWKALCKMALPCNFAAFSVVGEAAVAAAAVVDCLRRNAGLAAGLAGMELLSILWEGAAASAFLTTSSSSDALPWDASSSWSSPNNNFLSSVLSRRCRLSSSVPSSLSTSESNPASSFKVATLAAVSLPAGWMHAARSNSRRQHDVSSRARCRWRTKTDITCVARPQTVVFYWRRMVV